METSQWESTKRLLLLNANIFELLFFFKLRIIETHFSTKSLTQVKKIEMDSSTTVNHDHL